MRRVWAMVSYQIRVLWFEPICYKLIFAHNMMKLSGIRSLVIVLLLCPSLGETKTQGKKVMKPQAVTCYNRGSKCFSKKIQCPIECPNVKPFEVKVLKGACFVDCYSPKCEAVWRSKWFSIFHLRSFLPTYDTKVSTVRIVKLISALEDELNS